MEQEKVKKGYPAAVKDPLPSMEASMEKFAQVYADYLESVADAIMGGIKPPHHVKSFPEFVKEQAMQFCHRGR